MGKVNSEEASSQPPDQSSNRTSVPVSKVILVLVVCLQNSTNLSFGLWTILLGNIYTDSCLIRLTVLAIVEE